jgi:hypothetical protein
LNNLIEFTHKSLLLLKDQKRVKRSNAKISGMISSNYFSTKRYKVSKMISLPFTLLVSMAIYRYLSS